MKKVKYLKDCKGWKKWLTEEETKRTPKRMKKELKKFSNVQIQ